MTNYLQANVRTRLRFLAIVVVFISIFCIMYLHNRLVTSSLDSVRSQLEDFVFLNYPEFAPKIMNIAFESGVYVSTIQINVIGEPITFSTKQDMDSFSTNLSDVLCNVEAYVLKSTPILLNDGTIKWAHAGDTANLRDVGWGGFFIDHPQGYGWLPREYVGSQAVLNAQPPFYEIYCIPAGSPLYLSANDGEPKEITNEPLFVYVLRNDSRAFVHALTGPTPYLWVDAKCISSANSQRIGFVPENVLVRHAPINGSSIASTTSSVTPVRVLSKQDEWFLVVSTDGLTHGWILDGEIMPIPLSAVRWDDAIVENQGYFTITTVEVFTSKGSFLPCLTLPKGESVTVLEVSLDDRFYLEWARIKTVDGYAWIPTWYLSIDPTKALHQTIPTSMVVAPTSTIQPLPYSMGVNNILHEGKVVQVLSTYNKWSYVKIVTYEYGITLGWVPTDKLIPFSPEKSREGILRAGAPLYALDTVGGLDLSVHVYEPRELSVFIEETSGQYGRVNGPGGLSRWVLLSDIVSYDPWQD